MAGSVGMWVSRYLGMHVMYVCTYVRMYICTYVRMYVYKYVRMYPCVGVEMSMFTAFLPKNDGSSFDVASCTATFCCSKILIFAG